MAGNYLTKEKGYWGKILIDALLLSAAFLVIFYIWRGHLRIEPNFRKFLPVLFITWFIVTLFSSKFKTNSSHTFYTSIRSYFISVIVFSAILTLIEYVFGWYYLSRFIVYFTIALFLVFEVLLYGIQGFFKKNGRIRTTTLPSTLLFYAEFTLFIAVLSGLYVYQKKYNDFDSRYLVLALGVGTVWMLISLLAHNYKIGSERNILKILYPFWKAEIIITLAVIFFLHLALITEFRPSVILMILIGFSVVENLLVGGFYFLAKKIPNQVEKQSFGPTNLSVIDKLSREITGGQKDDKYSIPVSGSFDDLFRQQLEHVFLAGNKELYAFLSNTIDLKTLDITQSLVLNIGERADSLTIPQECCTFILNLAQSSRFRYLNRSLIRLNEVMQTGGILAGCFESLQQNKESFFRKYPTGLAHGLYFMNFLLNRVFPKLPLLRKLYFPLTRGRYRVVSAAEMLGRLTFCGFDILDLKDIDGICWFIARKERAPLKDENPSYGLLFRHKRIGKNGKEIFVYKFRTMYPYSEYLHDFVAKKFALNEISKIQEDFRITEWGKFLRPFWIDEYPMIINLLKGNVKLVGVRPLRRSTFNSYPEKLQKERVKYKPGIFPPYYADMPGDMEGVCESEMRYLKKYGMRPFRTDISYFFKIMINILFHHAKSG